MTKKKLVDAIAANDPATKRWKMTCSTARMAYESGELHTSKQLLMRALEMAPELPHSEFAKAACEIGIATVLLAEGKIEEAQRKLGEIVSGLEGASDASLKELLGVALRFRAQSLIEKKEYDRAESDLLRSIEVLKTLGENSAVQLAYAESDLSGLYLLEMRIDDAETWISKALDNLSHEGSTSDKEYVHAQIIASAVAPMNNDERMQTVSDCIQRMEYVYGQRHPTIESAVHRYLQTLKDSGNTERLREAEQKFAKALRE